MLAQEKTLRSEGSRSETRVRLIAAASEEFAQRGFANARVRHIVEQAHANLAAVNYHFGGKQGLYRATLAFLADQRPATPPAQRRRLSARARLERRIFRLIERFLKPQGSALGRILAHEAMNPTTQIEDVIAESLRPELAQLRALLQELVPEAEATAIDLAAIGLLGQCLLYQFAHPALVRVFPQIPAGRELCRQASRHIAALTVAGLACFEKNLKE
jgi:AcrR family transcriptional regulator